MATLPNGRLPGGGEPQQHETLQLPCQRLVLEDSPSDSTAVSAVKANQR
jgi:hypothetical protein